MSNNPNNYESLKLRGLKRKYEYVMKRGGKCEHCGYNGNLSALEFHHKNPEEKEFLVDIRAFSNHTLEKLESELDKCELLCSNCHREIHEKLRECPNIISFEENIKDLEYNKIVHYCSDCGKEVTKEGNKCPECAKKVPEKLIDRNEMN